jgi:outer membrane lipoprotein-sorting protein
MVIGCWAARSAVADSSPAPADTPAASSTTQPSEAHPPEAREALTVAPLKVLSRVQENLGKIESVQADFDEEKYLAVLNHPVKFRGSFVLKLPDQMIFIVREPALYAVRVDGETVSQWDKDTGNLQVIHLAGDPGYKAASEQIQAWILGNFQALAQSYDVYIVRQEPLSLRFVPKAASVIAKVIKNVEVTFNKDETNIDSMVIRETSGDRMTFRFHHPLVNERIAKGSWDIPPK